MIIIYTTFPDHDVACSIGKKLVEEGLAGCVNIFNGMTSLYKWEGKLAEESETAAFIKSTDDKFSLVTARLKELHPYDVPVVFSLRPDNVDPVYKKWLEEQLF